jgi:hypothetical protein
VNLALELAVIVAARNGRSTMPSRNSLDDRAGRIHSVSPCTCGSHRLK